MDRSTAIDRLPEAYAAALRLQDEGHDDVFLVRPEISDQPAHQARVVSFSEDFFVVHVVLKDLNAVLARAFQLFFQQLPLVQFGIVTVAGE